MYSRSRRSKIEFPWWLVINILLGVFSINTYLDNIALKERIKQKDKIIAIFDQSASYGWAAYEVAEKDFREMRDYAWKLEKKCGY